MIRLNEEGNYCWDPEDREKVYDAMAELNEESEANGYFSDDEMVARTNAIFERMRLRQLN